MLRDAAAELEALGYGAIWIGGSPGVSAALPLLAATSRIVVATGILSVWQHDADAVAAAMPGDRFLLGLGVSHAPAVAGYRKPYEKMVDYLDALDAAARPVPAERRVLAALGPRMLRLAAARAAGAHPYLAPVEHTAAARETLGPGPLLAPEVNVVLEVDAERARRAARAHLVRYLELPNYTNNLRRYGFDDGDFASGGSDRVVDSLYLWGDEGRIRARVDEYLAAGADHVAVQVIRAEPDANPALPEYRRLAAILIG
ncbi:TIGR03620 family F420-dependent LLM class oxidoreductase [Asanoa sp. WMMD1127]|uniref:TIGR03620 family F420-dependent LLM class oxidoreductase n=1 Tax=Asanoa sp. WMMD1127 TaxID=3016107 RepID=UPI0024166478|nr:TIGR03620 family F420-dependent LLM class oxidoreductase [Asanoa sp. WMMD1127]MDG4821155.1 TIGR03620 family F420-dependent LLM class oxidoreductase [Asanoa sp. WMMD1127]